MLDSDEQHITRRELELVQRAIVSQLTLRIYLAMGISAAVLKFDAPSPVTAGALGLAVVAAAYAGLKALLSRWAWNS
jgi:hypothetical protein